MNTREIKMSFRYLQLRIFINQTVIYILHNNYIIFLGHDQSNATFQLYIMKIENKQLQPIIMYHNYVYLSFSPLSTILFFSN